jgi:hypothetical protein
VSARSLGKDSLQLSTRREETQAKEREERERERRGWSDGRMEKNGLDRLSYTFGKERKSSRKKRWKGRKKEEKKKKNNTTNLGSALA